MTDPDEGFGRRAADAADDAGAPEVTPLPAAGAVGVSQPKATTGQTWADLVAGGGGVARAAAPGTVWLDGVRKPSLDVSVPQIGAPEAWGAGFTGTGVNVAVLDTGIDTTHPDLAGKVTDSRNFVGGDDDDLVGHGTHVASTIVGSGAASGGRYRGVAPDATLISGKVCDFFCFESDILSGMQWAADSGAQVVNMSLGGDDTPGTDPLEAAVDRLSAETGTLFVVAAGNKDFGPDRTTSSPATADAALAVGAVDDHDQLADFSLRGPRLGDAALKPEVTAPGVDIVAARARNGFPGVPVDDDHTSMSGTSMATPHVAGAAAILAQQHPDWSGEDIKASLIGASHPTGGVGVFGQGAGRIDIARAVGQDVTASPAVVSAGRPRWPHTDDEPTTHTVTYSNPGPAPVTLALSTRTLGPGGQPAPAGMLTLGATQVVVPAGGKAGVDVTIDTRVPAPTGEYGAWITATGASGSTVVTTPVAVDVEPELYELNLVARDDDGDLTSDAFMTVMALDRPETLFPFPEDESGAHLRLPPGHYSLEAAIFTFLPEEENTDAALMVLPNLNLTADTTVELDARQAAPVEIDVRRAEAERRVQALSYNRFGSANALNSGVISFDQTTVRSAQVGPTVAPEAMVTELAGLWAVPDANGEFLRSPRSYQLAWFERGRMITGASRVVRDSDLAVVRNHLRASGAGRFGERAAVALEADVPRSGAALSSQVSAAWTFRSAHVDGSAAHALPLMAVRFQPRLDDANQAPAGKHFAVPFSIESIGGAGHHVERPEVEVSYDVGATWTPATVKSRPGGTYAAVLQHPAGGDVSLRATVTDAAGNKVEQTIIRAYHLTS